MGINFDCIVLKSTSVRSTPPEETIALSAPSKPLTCIDNAFIISISLILSSLVMLLFCLLASINDSRRMVSTNADGTNVLREFFIIFLSSILNNS